jgi:hypothetical protein
MKVLRVTGVIIVILAVLAFSIPALAATTDYTIQSGIEIFPGIDLCGNNWGATFVAQISGGGTLRASLNYYGTEPVSTGTAIFGGNWTLTLGSGTITGLVTYGTVAWEKVNGNQTGKGTVHLDLRIIGGTGIFRNISRGPGSTFDGHDVHESGLKIGNIQIPTVDGTLHLIY